MSRFLFRMGRPTLALAACAALALASGCSTPAALTDVRYDLGPAPAVTAGAGPAIKVLDVRATDGLDSDRFLYRLAYADAQRVAVYRDSRWAAPPAQLLTQRLRTALSAHGAVLEGGAAVSAPLLSVELDEFEQVFDGRSESHAAIAARATLTQGGKVLGQRTFVARAPAATADAEGGARALAAASDALVAQIAAWLGARSYAAQ